MRIVYLHQYFTTPEMSGGTRSYEFARRLVAAGHEVHMITSDTEGSGKPYDTFIEGIKVTWIPVPYSNYMGVPTRIKAFLSFALKSALIAARSPADLIFATSTPLTIAIPGIYAKWRQRIPMVFEVRDLWPATPIGLGVLKSPVLQFAARQLERFAYRNSDRVIALSEAMASGVEAQGYPLSKITVIPNGSDLAFFNVERAIGADFRRRNSWLQDRPLVVYAGTFGFANDVTYMVKLAREALDIDPEIRFLAIGHGKEQAEITRLAESFGVYGVNFFIMPSVRKQELPVVLSAATVTSSWVRNSPVMWANSANKFFDSLAAARPIVINHEGWQADLIRTDGIGLVLPSTDLREAAKILISHLRDASWVEQAGLNALKVAEERFSRDKLVDLLNSVLAELGQERHGAQE